LGCGSFVLSRLILSYGLLITILHGLFLGETVTVFGWIGIALVICSLYFVKGEEKGDYVKVTKKWVISISLSVLFAGLYGIMQRQQQVEFSGRYDNEFMVISLAVSAVSLFVLGLVKEGKDLRMLKSCGLYALGAGVSNGATNLLSLYVYTIAPMSFVAPMNAGVSMLISFLISKLIFREKFSKSQYFGVILGAVALLLVNI
jgi:drug/metabolite transporter (DMT)-like permease